MQASLAFLEEGVLLGLHTAHVVAWAGEAASRMATDPVVVLLKDRGERTCGTSCDSKATRFEFVRRGRI